MNTDEPAALTLADLAAINDYIDRTNHVDNLKTEARRLLAEVDRLRARERHHAPVPDWFFGGTRVPVDMSTDARWHTVAAAAAGLLVHIDATPYAYPAPGQDTADFARDQLAHAAAAALWALIAHGITTGEEDHLNTFITAIVGGGRLPEAAAEAIGPALAQLVNAAVPIIAEHLATEATS